MNRPLPGESALPEVPPPPPEYFALPPAAQPAAATAAAPREPAAPARPAPMAAADGENSGKGCLWAGCGFALVALLLLLAAAAVGLWAMRDRIAALLATTITAPAEVSTADSATVAPAATMPDSPPPGKIPPAVNARPASARQPVRVTLRWDKPVDLDLEIWDHTGRRFIERAFKLGGRDISDGSQPEYFEFRDYGALRFASGEFVVSVCFANEREPRDNQAELTLTVTLPDGRTVERTGTVYWQRGRDQWHAFRIDAVTGEITDIRRYVDIRNSGRDV